jgi:hypothetical protein
MGEDAPHPPFAIPIRIGSIGGEAVIRSSRPWLVEVCKNPPLGRSATAEPASGIMIGAF